jgi:hypothetical protein
MLCPAMEVGEGFVDFKRMTCLPFSFPLPLGKDYLLLCLMSNNSHILCLLVRNCRIFVQKFSPPKKTVDEVWVCRKAHKMPIMLWFLFNSIIFGFFLRKNTHRLSPFILYYSLKPVFCICSATASVSYPAFIEEPPQ